MKGPGSILGFGALFIAIFAGSYFMLKQGQGRPAPVNPAFQPIDEKAEQAKQDPEKDKAKEAGQDKESGKAKETKPPVDSGPLVLNTWDLPKDQRLPDRQKGLEVIIDPRGPKVITQNKTAAVVWDAETRVISKTERLAPGVSIENATVDGRSAYKVFDRNKRELLSLRESPTRAACVTPDGGRVIAVGNPGMYAEYTTIAIPSGKTTVHPAEVVNNVRLFEVGGFPLAEWGPKRNKLDDDIHAVAMAPDGRSFFVLTKTKLMQISFARAFNVQPLSR